jgi:hypothetical protein
MPEPSFNKARHVCQEFSKHGMFGDGTPMNVSRRMIDESWARYAPVAHLWAAYQLNEYYRFARPEQIFAEDLSKFLSVAAGIEQFVTSFVPKRSRLGPLLKQSDIWAIPSEIEPRVPPEHQAPEQLVSYLRNYKA